MSETDGSRRYLIGGAAAACAVCCATPLLTLFGIGLAGTAATVAALAFAGVVFAIVVGVGTIAALWRQRRRRPTATTPAAVHIELTPRRPEADR
jgi:hypothetical protein